MEQIDPLEALERSDKHYLGSGTGYVFAPRYPCWLDWPGFWDEIDVYSYQLAPLFTVSFLNASGDRLRVALPRQQWRRWSPAELVCRYDLGESLEGEEHRSVLPGGVFLSEWEIVNRGRDPLKLIGVAWSAQDTSHLGATTVQPEPGRIRWRRRLEDARGGRLDVDVFLEAAYDPTAAAAVLSEKTALQPRWEFTPFSEKWCHDVESDLQVADINSHGVLYLAATCRASLRPGGTVPFTFRARVVPTEPGGGEPAERGSDPPFVVAGSPDGERGPRRATAPGSASRARWGEYFDSVPKFECTDDFFQHYWYYRWYGLQLCGHEGGAGNYVHPGCCEGTGYFHVPIAYSAQCHARELRWLPDPGRARGVILNFLEHQKESGQLHGRIYYNHLEKTDFYFSDWGDAVLSVDAVHPDREFLRDAYAPLAAYAEWLTRERDGSGIGLTDVIDHYETGQEYMSRYMAVSAVADRETWGNLIRLKGVDASVYTWRLQKSLAVIADRLEERGESERWTRAADRTAKAIGTLMWDEDSGMYSDYDPATMQRTGVKAAVCFYPYFTELASADQASRLRQHLFDPSQFWTAYPVPSTSADDPSYSPNAEWKGKRHNCPWNGRVWPMANSHIAEAIARVAIEHDPTLRPRVAEFIRKFVRMLFQDGDPARPNCFEHYNPETGQPSRYRGFDDYQHSWVNDLIVKFVAGFRPGGADTFFVDPFPFNLRSLQLSRLPFRGHRIDVTIEGDRFWVGIDGSRVVDSVLGTPIVGSV